MFIITPEVRVLQLFLTYKTGTSIGLFGGNSKIQVEPLAKECQLVCKQTQWEYLELRGVYVSSGAKL